MEQKRMCVFHDREWNDRNVSAVVVRNNCHKIVSPECHV